MEHDVTAFWADIKKYEEALVKDPASYCFVPLAELYRKMGLLDDAIHVARNGCSLHPDYVGGYMVLGRAYFEKGMKEASKEALEKVIGFTPDNLLARKILSQIYAENGETAAAETTLRFILSYNPADHESQVLLDSLKASPTSSSEAQSEAPGDTAGGGFSAFDRQPFEFSPEDEEIIEDAEIVEDLADEGQSEEDSISPPPEDEHLEPGEDFSMKERDPLITVTMAELYVSQGFVKRALTIYRELLEIDPDNIEWKNRLYELKMAIDEDTAIARKATMTESAAEAETVQVPGRPENPASDDEAPAPAVTGDAVLGTLEKWLDAIRRRH